MRRLLVLALTAFPAMAPAQTYTDIYWELLAIDGQLTDIPAKLRIDVDNVLAGAAPCNRWSAANGATLPDLDLARIRSTRMACDRLADEQRFFDALLVMKTVTLDGDKNLILTGPEGRSMEFVLDRTDLQTVCKTCAPTD
ncbi:MAG: META domain-containing protein [Rhodobacterales bacterium]|nr:META domain-containing protein [Rhodobacterales bacterium]